MIPTFKYDNRSFNAVLKKAVLESSRAAPKVINGHAMGVALKAVEATEKADADRIAQILGQTGTQLNYTKKGDRLRKGQRTRGKAIIAEDSFAARIVNARRKELAGPDFLLWGNALEDAARKLIAARRRSVGFIKSGWLWAIRDLAQVVPGFRRAASKDAKAIGQRKGVANPAKATGGLFASGTYRATIENSALIAAGGKFQSPGAHNPLPIAEKGLAAAMRAEESNLRKHLGLEMENAMRKAGAL